jgi:hypothetical protein
MEGLYLYCVRERTEGATTFQATGIEERRKIFTIIHGELEAVVSRVSLSRFPSREIQGKVLEDLNWIREKAMIHEGVIEEAMKGMNGPVSVVPMRFGIIFKSKAGLKEILDRDSAKMKTLLNRIRGKEEWSVKIYLVDSKRYELAVREKSEEIRSKERNIASMPEGMAYFMEEELNETILSEVNHGLDKMMEDIFEELGKGAAESVKTRVLDSEMTGKTEKMVFNAAFLVRADEFDSFKMTLERIDDELETKGLHLEYSGPWPSFNFARSDGLWKKAC